MTTQELIEYYANLLILQYLGQPRAYATISQLVSGVIMGTSDPNVQLPTAIENAYNLTGPNPAQGVQLDVLGKYAGVSRTGQGFNAPITLNDADFLQLILMAITQNNSGSSLATIQSNLQAAFPGEVLVFDYQNMQMSYLISSTIGSYNLLQLFVTEGLLPHPMGVGIGSIIFVPTIDAFFGMTDYLLYEITHQIQPNASPFNTYESYQTDWPWLQYQDSIGPFYQQALLTEDGNVLTTEGGTPIDIE